MVKISKLELAVLLLTAAFLAFCAGWLLRGSGGSEPLRIESERTLSQPDEVVVLPAPTPEPTPEPTPSPTPAPTTEPGKTSNNNA